VTTRALENALIAGVLGEPGSPVRRLAPDPNASGSGPDWDYLCTRAMAHGLAPLLLRDLAEHGVSIPDPARARFAEVAEYCRGRARKCQFTLYRFLEVGTRGGLETTLLKGCALVGTTYPDPQLRPMEDIDLLVRQDDVALARAVGEEIGLGLASDQLPVFFNRLIHFSQPLRPDLETLVPLDLHWRLHSPALLFTDRIEQVWARRRHLSVYGFPTATLDASDQWLHLATHFWSHWGHTPAPEQAPEPAALVEETGVEAALKWVADLVFTTSRIAREIPARTLSERASEWSAQAETSATFALLGPLLAPASSAFARDVLSGLEPPAASGFRRRSASLPSRQVADPALDFRLGSLRRLPAWIAPPERYFRAVAGLGPAESAGVSTRLRLRIAHGARVLARIALAAAALPLAVAGRWLARRARSRRIRVSRSPARVAELLRKFSEFEIAYADRFAPGRRERGDA
jgi:hypothetical protein